jgi:ArsR family transcriptional regulator
MDEEHIIQRMLNYFSQSVPASPVNLEALADRLKVLAEPKRLLIFNLLMEGLQCNCELGDFLQMPPNLISHHLSKLRAAGLVDVERDAVDSRWVYYSVNRAALDELNATFGVFFDPLRIKPRRSTCGPKRIISIPEMVETEKR